MSSPAPRYLPFKVGDRTFQRLNLEHPEVGARILAEMKAGVPVYYDRVWPLTERFCAFLIENPELVADKAVLAVGAGVGMEAVVAGSLARRIHVNDMAPVALELLQEQLEANGIQVSGAIPGSFGEITLPRGVELVLACFVLYDPGTERAMRALLHRALGSGVPVLLADQNIGGHFEKIVASLEAQRPRSVRHLARDERMEVVRMEPPPVEET